MKIGCILVAGALTACGTTSTTGTVNSTPLRSPASTATPTTNVAVTGFGASTTVWNATHQEDHRWARGCCYNDDPQLAPVNGKADPPRYYALTQSHGVLTSYEMRLEPGTTIEQARLKAAAEFPADVAVVWYRVADSCAEESVTSALVQRNLVSSGYATPSDPPYYLVEFDTANPDGTSAFDAKNINDMILNSVGSATVADALAC